VTRRYKAFISYSWADRAWGEWLHRTLETYRAPKGVADGQSLHPIFKDREEEAAGGSVGAAIEAALDASEFLIVICSPRSAKSMWVNREVAWFKTHKNKANILALIVDGEPGASATPGREAEESFPKTLTHQVGSDLQPTDDWEDAPLAADARPEGDGRRGAKLKLAAALLGVGLDALVRRDERRRTIRRRFVTGASLALATVLGGLSIYAFTQRDAAVVAQKEAVKARDDAEGIIELILTDLKSDLEGFGTLKSVTAIGNRAVGYYEGQDVKALTPDQLGRRARVLLMLGEADNKRGDLTAALARYETAAATTKEQLTRDPENPQRMFDHAQSVFWVGYIAWQRGDRTAAKHQFTEYHDLAQALVAKDPANEDWKAELDYAYSNLGTLAMDDGEAAEAEAWFRKSLEIALARLAKAPDDADRVWAIGQAYTWLSDSLHRQGKLQDAAQTRRNEIDLYVKRLSELPNDAKMALALATAHYRLAQTKIALGQLDSALTSAERATLYFDQLLMKDHADTVRIERTSLAHSVLGEVLHHLGRTQDAKVHLERAIALANELLTHDAGSQLWIGQNLIQPKLIIASLEAKDGNFSAAVELFASVVEVQRALLDSNTGDPILVRRYCQALAGRSRLSNDFNNAWIEIISILGTEEKKHGPEAHGLLAEAYQRIGKREKAQAIVAKLYATGYRHPDFLTLIEEFPALKSAAERRVH